MSINSDKWFVFKRERKEQRAKDAKLHFGEAIKLKKNIVSSHRRAKQIDLQRRQNEHQMMLGNHKIQQATKGDVL